MSKCLNCGNEFNGNFCPVCGTKAEASVFCPNCGAKFTIGTRFCSNCGSPISANTVPSASKPVANTDTEELQNELYSLYKILEPIRELDIAGLAVDAKIEELNKPLPAVRARYYDDFAHYLPFVSVDIDKDFLTPSDRTDAKTWKLFIKRQKDKLYGKHYYEFADAKYNMYKVYSLFKSNESKVLSDIGASFLYYKMDYSYSENAKFYTLSLLGGLKYKVINMFDFVESYLPKKLGSKDKCDKFLTNIFTNLKGGNKGEEYLCDIPRGYLDINVFTCNTEFYKLADGYPGYNSYDRALETENVAKTKTRKSIQEKQELEVSIAELCKLRENINATIDSYMTEVDEYISKYVKITPYNYASQWRCVTYFLHLLVNKRGRDIYEVINQYEIDMKHKELTSALGDIHTEIRNQTKVLGSKLDTINRSIIAMTDAITSAIYTQTKTLGAKLDSINYSVISSGASIVGAIQQLGASMSDAMSNMQFSVSIE